jgi:hypothetical protein
MTPPPPLLAEWKRCLFQRPLELCSIYNETIDNFGDRAAEFTFRASPAQSLALFTFTMRNLSTIVADCSDQQIAFGLNAIFNPCFDNICHDVMREPEHPELRLDAIQSIYALYSQFLAQRCAPVLSHRNEQRSSLDLFHYMIWDVSPLSDWGSFQEPKLRTWPFLDVLERVLYLPHDGCIESAMHGLGHSVYRRKDSRIPALIDRFLAATPGLRPELRHYALAARTGMIP